MKLSSTEKAAFKKCIKDLLSSEYVQEMNQYIQHGNTSTYRHCLMVAYYSYWLCLRLHIPCDLKSVARGALLHDFYLYDWHVPHESHRLHGFFHSAVALKNAKHHFKLNRIEQDIIEKHMWPLTLTKLPKCRESFIVCLMDKYCSTTEIIQFSTKNTFNSIDFDI